MTWAIGFHVLESTVFSVLIALLAFGFRNRGPSLRYALWFTGVAKFAVPAALFAKLGIGFASLLPSTFPSTESAASLPVRTFESLKASSVLAHHPHSIMPTILIACWMSGFVFTLGVWIYRCQNFRPKGEFVVGTEQTILNQLRKHLQIRRTVSLRCTDHGSEVALWGIRRPIIQIPHGLSSQLTSVEFEAVLLHELAHVRRWDNLSGAFVHVVVCVFWFHPLLWWMEQRLIVEREQVCDEMVIQSGAGADTYVAAILKVCRFQLGQVIAGASGISGSHLKHRMELIMSNCSKTPSRGAGRALVAALATAMTWVAFPAGVLLQLTETQNVQASTKQRGCEFANVEYPAGTVLQMGSSPSSVRRLCLSGSWEKTTIPATSIAKDQPEVVCKPDQSTYTSFCTCNNGVKYTLGAIAKTPNGEMRCDQFVLGQFSTWRPIIPVDYGKKK